MGDYNKQELETFLDFIDACDMVKISQLTKLFPNLGEGKLEKMKRNLLRGKRVHISKCGQYLHSTQIGTTDDPRPDRALTVALGVLGDLMPKVQYHHRAVAPAQVYFTTHSGGVFEIVYVGFGSEAMVFGMFKNLQKDDSEEIKRIVVIDDYGQIAKIKERIPGIWRFALIKQDDIFEYISPGGVASDD